MRLAPDCFRRFFPAFLAVVVIILPATHPAVAGTDAVSQVGTRDLSRVLRDGPLVPEWDPNVPSDVVPEMTVESAGPGQGWRPLKLYGGSVTALAVSPVNPNMVVAVNGYFYDGGRGLFASKDGGRSWSFPSLPVHERETAFDVEFMPDGTVYVAMYSALIRADANLTSWEKVDVTMSNPEVRFIYFFEVGINPNDPKEIWLGTQQSIGFQSPYPHVIRSLDGGTTWSDVTPPLTTQGAVHGIAFNPNHPERVVVVASGDPITWAWRTLDGGLSWTRGALPGIALYDVVHDGERFFVCGGTPSNSTNGGVFVSDDDGAGWTLEPRIGWPSRVVYDLEVDPARPGTILAATPKGIYRRSGGTWTFGIGGLSLQANCVAMTAGAPDRILGGYELFGVRRSENNGVSFVRSSEGMINLNIAGAASNPENPRELAATFYTPLAGGGVFVSLDAGETWTLQTLPNLRYDTIEFGAGGVLYAVALTRIPNSALEGVYRRNTDGSWSYMGPVHASNFGYQIFDVRASRHRGETIFACGYEFSSNGWQVPTVWRSTDRGTSWARAYAGTFVPATSQVLTEIQIVEDGTDQRIVVSKAGGPGGRVIVSGDGGDTWSVVDGIPQETTPWSLRGTPADPHTFYMSGSALSSGQNAPSLRSVDAGATWSVLAPREYFDGLDVDRENPDVVYGLRQRGLPSVARSVDGGMTFHAFDAGMTGSPEDFAWIDGDCPTLLMATDTGLYARDIDSVAPQISLELEPNVLWPPDHRLKTITARVAMQDACDASPTFALKSIAMTDVNGAPGDIVAHIGEGTTTFQLRAERSGKGDRRYLVTYTATDASGNVSEATAAVLVPHDNSGIALADDPTPRNQTPAKTELVAIEPNPFNPSTSAMIALAQPDRVTLNVYDVRGAHVRSLASGTLPAGVHRIAWDGTDRDGRPAASGVYFFRFVSQARTQTMKALLIK